MEPKIAGGKKLAIENLKHFLIWCTGKQTVLSIVYCTHAWKVMLLVVVPSHHANTYKCWSIHVIFCSHSIPSPPSLCPACFSVISQGPGKRVSFNPMLIILICNSFAYLKADSNIVFVDEKHQFNIKCITLG